MFGTDIAKSLTFGHRGYANFPGMDVVTINKKTHADANTVGSTAAKLNKQALSSCWTLTTSGVPRSRSLPTDRSECYKVG